MTIKLDKKATKDEIASLLQRVKPAKKLDVQKYAGKLKWGQDALHFQQELRNE